MGIVVGKEAARGPTGDTVATRLRDLRTDVVKLSYTELSERLKSAGWPISPVGIRRIEDGERKVTVDDLVALAVALGVSPVTLLIPDSSEVESVVELTGRDESLTALELWSWLTVAQPLRGDEDVLRFWRDSLPMFLRTKFMEALAKGQPIFPPPMQQRKPPPTL